MHMEGICSITKHAFPPKSTPVTWDFPPPPLHGFPSLRNKYHMVKVPHLWDFSPPPPSQTKSHMLSQYYIWKWCWRRFAFPDGEGLPYGIIPPWGSSAIGILPGGGGGNVCHMVLFPPGEVLLWDFFRGRFFIWYNFRGDNLT